VVSYPLICSTSRSFPLFPISKTSVSAFSTFPGEMSAVQSNPPAAANGGICHIVAMPYPGRGHINPMMNLCHSLLSKHPNILITFILTEEWLDLIGGSDNSVVGFRFATVPNVIPSELVRGKDFKGFVKAVCTKLQAPFENILDGLTSPVNAIVADTYLPWMCDVGSSRGIPVASLWTMSATVFSVFLHFDLLLQNRHFPFPDFSGIEEEKVDYIPGLPPTRILDLQPFIGGLVAEVLDFALESVSRVSKVQYLLFTSPYELESKLIDALKTNFQFPVYPIGPSIPHLKLPAVADNVEEYFSWLDAQPRNSVLYISMGSFLSASETQTEEIVAGVVASGVRFLLVARGEAMVAAAAAAGGGGRMVVPWCDQLKVLCHDSIGGFWTHCGMNSTMEGVYAGVPMLCWPLFIDQFTNCKAIVEDWGVGWRVRRKNRGGGEEMVKREEVAEVVKRFMKAEEKNGEVEGMRKRASELREVIRATVAEGGSSDLNLDSFIKDISNHF
ncbi:UDP-glycosyltransferase 87A2, partial [Linum perenne]